MGAVNNLNAGNLAETGRAIRQIRVATPMNSASIGAGGVRVYDGGVITIENGGLKVTGSAEIIGTLIASGIIQFTGELTQSGESTFTGPTHFQGATDVTGDFDVDGPMTTTSTLDVQGVTTLKNDLNVTASGKINAGAVTIDPSYLSGSVKFSNGTAVAATPNGAQMVKSGGGAVTVSSGQADIGIPGGGAVIADGSGVAMVGVPQKTGVTANVYIDPSTGRLYRVP